MANEPVRTTTLKNYLREQTQMRVSADAADRLTKLVTTQLDQVAARAAEEAAADERNTLLDRDIEQAFDGWLKSAGPSLLSAEAMLTAINGLDNDALTALIQHLQAQLKKS